MLFTYTYKHTGIVACFSRLIMSSLFHLMFSKTEYFRIRSVKLVDNLSHLLPMGRRKWVKILSLCPSSTPRTLPYSPPCFWYSQLPDSSCQTFHCWLPRLSCLRPSTGNYLPLPLRQKPSLDSFKPASRHIFLQNNRPVTFSAPRCFLPPPQVLVVYCLSW